MKTKLEKTLHHATDTITQLLLCLDRPDLIGEDFEEYKQNAMSEAGKVQKDIWFNYLRKTTPDNRKNLVADNHRPMKRDGSFYWYNQHGEIPDYDWWKNDPVEIFRKRLGDYETELVTVYAIEDPKTWIVHHQDVTGTLNYQREFESEDVAMSHAKSLKMHFSDKPLAEGVTPKFRMI